MEQIENKSLIEALDYISQYITVGNLGEKVYRMHYSRIYRFKRYGKFSSALIDTLREFGGELDTSTIRVNMKIRKTEEE